MSEEAADNASDEKRGRSKRLRKKIRPVGRKRTKRKAGNRRLGGFFYKRKD